jgi:hypothetical protein
MYGVELGRVNQKEQDKNKDKGVNALKMFIALMFYKPKKTSVSCHVSRYPSLLFSLLFSPFIPFFSSFLLHHQTNMLIRVFHLLHSDSDTSKQHNN